jgi:hypothetical protein
LSVLLFGAPDCPVCHRTVSGAPGSYRCQLATLGKMEACSAIIHRTVLCATTLSDEPAEQRLPAPIVDSAKCYSALQCHDRSQSAEVRGHRTVRCGTRLSGVAPDCPVWHRTVQCGTGLSGATRRQVAPTVNCSEP